VTSGPSSVHVRVPASLRAYCGGSSTVDVDLHDLGDKPTVRALLDHLVSTHPDLECRIRDEQGRLRRHVNLFLGNDNVRDLSEQDTSLAAGVEVAVMPAVSGG
jgi:sulfur-carrier protein